MALYVKDAEIDRLADQLSRIARTSKTEVVRRALRRELDRVEKPSEFVERGVEFTRGLIAKGDPKGGHPADKAWVDSLYEDV